MYTELEEQVCYNGRNSVLEGFQLIFFKPEEFENAGFAFYCGRREIILKMKLSENDDTTLIMIFPYTSFTQHKNNAKWPVIVAFSNSSGTVWTCFYILTVCIDDLKVVKASPQNCCCSSFVVKDDHDIIPKTKLRPLLICQLFANSPEWFLNLSWNFPWGKSIMTFLDNFVSILG